MTVSYRPPPQESGPGEHLDFDWITEMPERAFDDLTALASAICKTPVALVSLAGENFMWFKSKLGIQATEIPRENSFCEYAMGAGKELTVIPDTLEDERFEDNPLVTGESRIRFYAGAPLVTEDGAFLGTLCVADQVPRELNADQERTLIVLAQQVVAQLELRRQAKELRKRESHLSLALDAATIGTFDWDLETNLIERSLLSEELIGYGPGEYDGTFGGFARRVHPEDMPGVNEAIERSIATRQQLVHECRIVFPDGEIRWIEARGTFSYDEFDGSAVRMRGILRDRTERHRAEEALRESEEQLRLYAEYSPMAVAMLDRDMRYLIASRTWMESFRLGDESLVGRSHYEVFPGLPQRWKEAHQRCLAGAVERSDEDSFVRADGRTEWIRWEVRPWYQDDGEIGGIILFSEDITGRKEAEAALKLRNDALEHALNGFDLVDADGKFIYANRAYLDMWGYDSLDEIVGTSSASHYADPELPGKIIEKLREDGEYSLEMTARRKDGSTFEAIMAARLIQDAAGNEIYSGASLDITEQRKAQESIRHMNRVHAVLSEINQTIVREKDPQVVLDASCRIAVESGGFLMAWIGLLDLPGRGLRIAAHANASEETIAIMESLLRDSESLPSCVYTREALESGAHGVCNDIASDEDSAAWRDAAVERGYRSMASLPLTVDERTVGTFNLYSGETNFFDEEEIRLLDELACDISFALEIYRQQAERLRVGKALENSEAQLSHAMKIARLAYWEFDVEKGEFTFNDTFYELFRTSASREGGYTMAFGEFADRFWHPDDVERVKKATRAAVASPDGGPSFQIEHRVIFPDGETGHFSVRVFVVRDEQGRAVRTYGVNQDVTERKQAEEAVNKAEQRFRSLIEHSVDCIVMSDAANRIVYTSPAVESVEGYSPADLIGRGLIDDVHPDDRTSAEATLQDIASQPGKPVSFVWRSRHKEGRWLWLEGVSTNLLDDPAVGAVVTNYRDITKRRQLEEELRQSQKLEAIGQLAGGVAHDFNNILTVIQGYGSLLLMEEGADPDTAEAVQQIVQASERAANLTRQLLAFSRRQVMQPREVDLNENVTHLTKMLQRILGEDIRLNLDLHPSELLTFADPGMLDQILLNLVVNARDAMPSGGRLTVRTGEQHIDKFAKGALSDCAPGDYLCLGVTDTGTGISPQNLSRIFEPFFTTKEQGKGTGLGLSTVFGIVKQHGGAVEVESELGKGTTFRILLPALDGKLRDKETKAEKAAPRGGSETILLVEDEKPVRLLVRNVFERAGYTVLEAASGVEALRVWNEQERKIDLLFTDIVMPEGVSGLELASRMREADPGLKVIFTSGYSADIAGRGLALQHGQNFLQKPSPPEQLLATVRKSLDE